MKITLVTGRTLYEATNNTLKFLDDDKFKNYVILPDRFALQTESLVLDRMPNDVCFNVDVMGLTRLAFKLLPKTQFDAIEKTQSLLIIYEIMKSMQADFLYYKKIDLDVCEKFDTFISLLKSSNVNPEMIKQDTQSDFLNAKLHDIKLVYQMYEQKTQDKLDDNKLINILINYIDSCSDLSGYRFFFVNFDSFTANVYGLLQALAKKTDEIFIAYATAESELNSYIYETDILDKLRAFSKENDIIINVIDGTSNKSEKRYNIIRNLFSFNCEEGNDRDNFFRSVSCFSKREQIEFVAKYIRYQVYLGQKYSDFQVATDDLESDAKLFEQIFNSFAIPYNADISKTAKNTFYGEFLINIIKSLAFGLNKELVKYFIVCLSENDISLQCKKIDYENIDSFKKICKFMPEEKEIFKLLKVGLSKNTIADISQYLLEFLIKINEKMQKNRDFLQKNALFDEILTQDMAFEKIENILIQSLNNNVGCSKSEYLKLLSLCLENVNLTSVPAYVNGVFVGDIEKSFFAQSKVLFLLGGENLPKITSETALLSDEELKSATFSYKIEPSVTMINRRSRFKLFEVLTKPDEKLFVLYSIGKEIPMYLQNLQTIYAEQESIICRDFFDFSVTNFFENSNENRLKFALGTLNCASENILKLEISKGEKVRLLDFIGYDFKGDYIDEMLCKSKNNKSLYFPKNYVKVSQIEKYFSCPFSHFLCYGLKVQELRENKIYKNDYGTIIHAFCEFFMAGGYYKSQDIDFDKLIYDNFDKVLPSKYNELVKMDKGLRLYLISQAVSVCKKLKYEYDNSSFTPVAFEKKIYIPNMFKVHSDFLDFYGVVDRIDEFENFHRIIDYKTGSVHNILKDLYYGKKIQLVAYMGVLNLKEKKAFGGVFYFIAHADFDSKFSYMLKGVFPKDNKLLLAYDNRFENVGFKSDIVGGTRKVSKGDFDYLYSQATDCDFDKMAEYSKKITELACTEIIDGYIEPTPMDNACEYCPYHSICKGATKQRYELKVINFLEKDKDNE